MTEARSQQRFLAQPPSAAATTRRDATPSNRRDVLMTALTCALGLGITGMGMSLWQRTVEPGQSLVTPRSVDDVETVVALGASLLGALVVCWWFVALATAFIGAWLLRHTGRRSGHRVAAVAPAFMRRLAMATLGVTLIAAPAAQAAEPAAPLPVAAPAALSPAWVSTAAEPAPAEASSQSPAPTPKWQPARPAQPIDRILGGTDRSATVEVIVASGDSLWTIAARDLGPGATAAEIAAEWPRWYQHNRALIGPDPDHLVPGTALLRPTAVPVP